MSVLNDAVVYIDNDRIGYKSNSVEWKKGKGDVNSRAVTSGGGQSETVHAVDADTRIGEFMIKLQNTIDAVKFVEALQEKVSYVIKAVVGDNEYSTIFENSKLVTDPNIVSSSDGEIALEFKCNPTL
jgi:hypothetical protein